MKRNVSIVAGISAVLALAGIAYFLWFTSAVEVSDEVPVAPTLAAPTSAAEVNPSPTSSATEALAAPVEPTSVTGAAPTEAPTAAAQAAETQVQVYRIDSTQSTATYTVNEVFLRENQPAQAIGRTNAVAGDILIDRTNPTASQVGDIVVDISQLASDSERRDNALRREWLESATYPLATFSNIQIVDLPATLEEGVPFTVQLQGDMNIHDTTQPLTWDATLVLEGTTLRGSVQTIITLRDFNVEPPNIAGMISSDETAALGLNFIAVAVEP